MFLFLLIINKLMLLLDSFLVHPVRRVICNTTIIRSTLVSRTVSRDIVT